MPALLDYGNFVVRLDGSQDRKAAPAAANDDRNIPCMIADDVEDPVDLDDYGEEPLDLHRSAFDVKSD